MSITNIRTTCLLQCSDDCSRDSSHDTDRSVFLGALNVVVPIAVDTDFPLAIRGGGSVVDDVRRSDGLGIASDGGMAASSTACVMCSADCCNVNEKMLQSLEGHSKFQRDILAGAILLTRENLELPS